MSSPHSPGSSFRHARLAMRTTSSPLAASQALQSALLSNSQRMTGSREVSAFACDQRSILSAKRSPALEASANYRNLTGRAPDLTTDCGGSEELSHVRDLEQFYVNELRTELERNRVYNLSIQQKNEIYEKAEKRFYRLIIDNSLAAYAMTSDLPIVYEQFQQVFGAQQRRREENYESVRLRHQQLSEQMRKNAEQAQNSVRNSEELREQLIKSHFDRWQAIALQKGQAVSVKYDRIDYKIKSLEKQMADEARARALMTQHAYETALSQKELLDREYTDALYERQQFYEELSQRVFNGRSRLFDEFVRQKRDINERKAQVKHHKMELEREEIQQKSEKIADKNARFQRKRQELQSELQAQKDTQRYLLDLKIQRSRQVLEQSEQQRVLTREELVQMDLDREAQKQQYQSATMRHISAQADVEHHKQMFFNQRASPTSGAERSPVQALPENLRKIIPESSILNMPREQALQKVADYENAKIAQYRGGHVTASPQSYRRSTSASNTKSPSSSYDFGRTRIQDAERIYTPASRTRKSAARTAQGGDGVMNEDIRRNNEAQLGLIEQERYRDMERSVALESQHSPEQKEQLAYQFEAEREAFEGELEKLEHEHREQGAALGTEE